jgi:hypothetical protein
LPTHCHEEIGRTFPHAYGTKALDKAPAIAALKKQFGMSEELIETYSHPYVYLNHKLIQEKGLDQAMVENVIAKELLKFNGVGGGIQHCVTYGEPARYTVESRNPEQFPPETFRRYLFGLRAECIY